MPVTDTEPDTDFACSTRAAFSSDTEPLTVSARSAPFRSIAAISPDTECSSTLALTGTISL
jgi:hypothetical protein